MYKGFNREKEPYFAPSRTDSSVKPDDIKSQYHANEIKVYELNEVFNTSNNQEIFNQNYIVFKN